MKRDKVRLNLLQQSWLYTTSGILFFSGAVWLMLHRYYRIHSEFGESPQPLEPWCLKLHGAAAMVFLVLFGSLLPNHVRRGWRQRKNRFTGAVFIGLNAFLILTGYGLYYIGGEASRLIISQLHWGVGFTFPLLLVWHIWVGRKEAARRRVENSESKPNLETRIASPHERRMIGR